jgi:hypothetical protein
MGIGDSLKIRINKPFAILQLHALAVYWLRSVELTAAHPLHRRYI